MPKNIGKRISALRKELDMTQKDLAARAHIAQSTLSDIETFTKMPTGDTIVQIAAALGVPPSDLLGERTCPVCGFEYTYAEGLSSESHIRQHQKAQRIAEKYGFYWAYPIRMARMDAAYSILEDKYADDQQKYDAALDLLKALFSRSVFAYSRDDHPPFDIYVKMMLNRGNEGHADIPASVFARLRREYGSLPGLETGSYYEYSGIDSDDLYESRDPRLESILAALPGLPPHDLAIIEAICDLANSK